MTVIGNNAGIGSIYAAMQIGAVQKIDAKTQENQQEIIEIPKKSAADEFLEYARKSPAEKIRMPF